MEITEQIKRMKELIVLVLTEANKINTDNYEKN